jgi:hypothetical protein
MLSAIDWSKSAFLCIDTNKEKIEDQVRDRLIGRERGRDG